MQQGRTFILHCQAAFVNTKGEMGDIEELKTVQTELQTIKITYTNNNFSDNKYLQIRFVNVCLG